MMEELPGQHTEQDKTFQNTAECGGYLKFHLEIFHAYFQAGKKEGKKGNGRNAQPGEPGHHNGGIAVARAQIGLKPVERGGYFNTSGQPGQCAGERQHKHE